MRKQEFTTNNHRQSSRYRADSDLTPDEREHQWCLLTRLVEARKCANIQEARKVLYEVEHIAILYGIHTSTFDALYVAVALECFQEFRPKERRSYPFFREQLHDLIPGSSIIQVKYLTEHHPDFFVEREGLISPVEIKAMPFTTSNVKQLQRYMVAYQCQTGYAVAPSLKGKLLPGMMFVQWDGKRR